MPRSDAKLKEVDLPTRVDVVSERDSELDSEFDADSSLADTNPELQFRRADRRVTVRKGALPKKTAGRIRVAIIGAAVLSLAAVAYGSVYRYGTRSWRFRMESSDDISVSGLHKVPRSQVMDVLGGDIGRWKIRWWWNRLLHCESPEPPDHRRDSAPALSDGASPAREKLLWGI